MKVKIKLYAKQLWTWPSSSRMNWSMINKKFWWALFKFWSVASLSNHPISSHDSLLFCCLMFQFGCILASIHTIMAPQHKMALGRHLVLCLCYCGIFIMPNALAWKSIHTLCQPLLVFDAKQRISDQIDLNAITPSGTTFPIGTDRATTERR